MIEHVTPSPVVEFIAPAPSVTHVTPSEQFSPLPQETGEVVQIGFVHPPGSMSVVKPSASHVVGSLLLLDEFATPVHQEQIACEQIVNLPIPQVRAQIVEGVKEIPQEPFPEQTVEQIIDDPNPPIWEGKAGVILPSCAAAHAAPTPVSEYGALARDVGYTTPEISKRTVEQIVDDPEDDEQNLFGY